MFVRSSHVGGPELVFRGLSALAREAGFQVVRVRSHGYVEVAEPRYMLTIIDSLIGRRP
jgi:hypothetical protein